jgi:hypothetical protein
MDLVETDDPEDAHNAYIQADYFMKGKTPYEYRKEIVIVPGV